MNIGRFAVTRPVAVTMRIAALVLLGIICFLRLPVDLLPKVDFPTVAVNVNWPNTSPEEMETQITRPIEQAVATVQGQNLVTSTSSVGSSSVRIQFEYGTNLGQAAVDVMQQVQRAKRRFPNDPNISEPGVFKFDPSSLPILSYGVSGGGDLIKLRAQMINEISPIIESATGVAAVNISGGQDRAIIIDVDPDKLRTLNLSIGDVSRRIRQENITLPAGFVREGATEYSIRSIGYFKSIDEIRNLPLKLQDGQLVKLSQVANVRDASQDIRSYTRMNGEPALSISISKQSDANTVATAASVKEKIAEVEKRYPGLKFGMVNDQSLFIEHSIADLQQTAIIGGALAILIILFFLRNLRSTFVIALSIPVSIISTFALMYFCGFTLNTISLSGLALATGLIVDDAIVVLENIYRHIERDKKSAAEAAVSGTQEIMSAVAASTFTVMIVFLPLLLIKGQSGQTFTQFALVVVFSIGISLLDAVTVVPMLSSRMIKESEVLDEAHPELRAVTDKPVGPLTRVFDRIGAWLHHFDSGYQRNLEWALRHRGTLLSIAGAAIVAAVLLWPMVGKEQLPKTDTGALNIRVKLPVGTNLEKTDAAMKSVEAILAKDPDVETYIIGAGTNVGLRGGGGGGSPNEGGGTVALKANRKSNTEAVVKRLQGKMRSIPGIQAQVSPFDIVANIIGGANTGLSVDVYGQDLAQLSASAKMVRDALTDVPGLENVDLSVQENSPEVQWSVDRNKAQSMNVSFQDVASTLSSSTNGELATYYQENGFQYPIYVQVPLAKRLSVDDIAALPVAGTASRGAPILLGQVATHKVGVGPNQIQRQNRLRIISVSGRLAERPESEVQADMERTLNKLQFAEGSYWAFGQQQQQKAKEFSGLGLSVFLAVALIYMLLATQFESFVYPLVVLTSVPLCSIGLVLALFLTDRSFGITAFIGLLMLIGIVVKNGILLVEYTNQLRSRGMARDEAILLAAPTRLRPILMTTLCAILGMLPLALGLGSGSEIYVPLATSVIGGLTTSTLLTLFIVPIVYAMFDDLARKIRKDPRDLSHADKIEPSIAAAGHVTEELKSPAGVAPDDLE